MDECELIWEKVRTSFILEISERALKGQDNATSIV